MFYFSEILLEPETKYAVISVEENKSECPGITWIIVEMIDPSPAIESLTKSVEAVKEGKHKMILTSFYTCFLSPFISFICFTEKMKSAEWLAEQIKMAAPFPELCSFYLEKLSIACSPSSPNCTLKDSLHSLNLNLFNFTSTHST